ncbi:MAG: glycoside hydrolase family 2 TIM barrel-domain containing protein [Coriobacteriales bacterium]|nr:glycoside hydrolase family 2 TIM barrel-domain containing protein [Coriobacteriales bacterium]
MDLDIKRVLAAKPGEPEDVELTPLTTTWGDAILADPSKVPSEYPRPRMRRKEWTCLNGWWDYAITQSSSAKNLWQSARPPQEWDGRILVPFSPEAPLSGVGRTLQPQQLLWYRRVVDLVAIDEGSRLLLNFGAVDWACTCYVNGRKAGEHVGGYLPFGFDITDAAHEGANTIELCVYDPSEQGTQLRGKQRLRRGNMWYTAQSGIWQTVWLETVPAAHLASVDVVASAADGTLELCCTVSRAGEVLELSVMDATKDVVARASVTACEKTVRVGLNVERPHLWDVCDPYLYELTLSYGNDNVASYCAFRTAAVEKDEQGTPRFCLNHRPLFVRGLLDQGYWPDGLMTAPSDEALVYDIEAARAAGFNLLRKHIKVEQDRWYWHCDRLGMLVWQDMVSGGGIPAEWASANTPTLFRRSWSLYRDETPRSWRRLGSSDPDYREEWKRTAAQTVKYLAGHPCVTTWIVFNESWGQFESARNTKMLKEVDDTRPYIATSGWYDRGAGDYVAVHNYFRSLRVYKDPWSRWRRPSERAFVIDEFGGLTCSIEGHTSVDTVYGYDTYSSLPTWKEAVRALLSNVDALEEEGLSGFVYTQISDVEEETNGLLTYDRRINKLD